MRRVLYLFTLTAFTLWILPLGAFIKKSEEYRTCGGKRAFHMCCESGGKVRTASSVPVAYSTTSSEKSVPSGVSGTDSFCGSKPENADLRRISRLFENAATFTFFTLDRSIDRPPQLSPLV